MQSKANIATFDVSNELNKLKLLNLRELHSKLIQS